MVDESSEKWLVLETPAGPFCWYLGDPTDAELDDLIHAARVVAGVPANNDWLTDGSGYSVALTFGTPHGTLLDRATVGTLADLVAVDPAAVAEHRAALVEVHRANQLEAAKAALAQLDPEQVAELLKGMT